MKNIILQHFHPMRPKVIEEMENRGGKLPFIVEKSVENIKNYAHQKCAAINEEYDDYDTVVVLDTDKFVTTTCTENVFEAKGIAPFDDVHRLRQLPAFCQEFPLLGNMKYPLWSGAIYVMPREFRQLMRAQINPSMRKVFEAISPRPYVDEGIFHVLCHKAKFSLDEYLDEKWDYSSYLPNPEKANMIHIRHKPKTREENYKDLVKAGIIAE